MGCIPSSSKDQSDSRKQNGSDKLASKATEDPGETKTASVRKLSARWDPNTDYGNVRQRYKILDIVGHGRFGVVYKAQSKADPTKIVAIKVLKCSSYLDKAAIKEEIKILKDLDHPNIVKYYEEIEDGPYIFIVTEFCSGGELFDRIAGKERFNESEAAAIVEKLLCALNHCHQKRIAHRDIKPENILYTGKDEHAEVKLIDFGLAKKRTGNCAEPYQTMVGTPYYVAPEVIEGSYTFACDIWSLGVIMHVMLSGFMPFTGGSTEDIFRSIKKCHLSFEHSVWNKVTPPGRDLLVKLLEPDENKRLTAAEALKHRWFREVKSYTPEIDELDSGIMKSMKQYQGSSKFQKACMSIFVKSLKEEEINNLIEAFRMLDKEKNGYIGTKELVQVFHKYYPTTDISNMVAQLDNQGHGVINYSQFIASTLDAKQFLTKERLWALFQYFDIEGNGYLRADDIRTVLNKSGLQQYTLDDVNSMLQEHRIKETDCISFAQFAEIMTKLKFAPEEDMFPKVIGT